MAIIWLDGFEVGDADGFVAKSGGAIETTTVSKSVYAWRMNVAAATAYLEIDAPGKSPWWSEGEGTRWLTFHIYIDSLPGSSQSYYLWQTLTGAIERGVAWLDENGKVNIKSEGGTAVVSSGALTTGKWYTVSFHKTNSTHSRCLVRERDTGTEIIDVSATSGTSDRGMDDVKIGPLSTSTGNVVFDNFVMDDANDPHTALGADFTINALVPNATGGENDFTGDWDDVNEIPHDSTTTERTETAAQNFTDDVEASALLAHGVDSIEAVATVAYVITNTTGSSYNLNLRMREPSTTVASGNYGIGDGGPTSYTRGFTFVRTTSPLGSAWTTAILDTIEVGCGRSTSGSARTMSVTHVSAHVLFKVLPRGGTQAIIIA